MKRSKVRPSNFRWPLVLIVAVALFTSNSAIAAESPSLVFEKVWKSAKDYIYPAEKELAFTDKKYRELKARANEAADLDALSAVINPFLAGLRVSHTKFYTASDQEYYFLRSLFSTRRIDEPVVSHIGAMFAFDHGRYFVRTVLEGYPAAQAGLRRGDVVLEGDEQQRTCDQAG